MALHKIRLWREEVLYDCMEYTVEAPSVEAAGRLLMRLHEKAEAADGMVELPSTVRCQHRGRTHMHALDGHEVIRSENGATLIDDEGDPIRQIDVDED